MPLLAAALLAYAAGLVLGFGGVLVPGSCATVALLALAAARRSYQLAACAVAGGAALLVAQASATIEQACRRRAAAAEAWVAVIEDAAFPGGYVRARARVGRCEVHAALLVERGAAPAGSEVAVRGSAVPSSRGIRILRATVRRTNEKSALLAMRAAAGRSIDSAFRRDAALARALLVADQRAIDPAMRDRFAAAGIVHMLSISGLHVALIAAAIHLCCVALRLSRSAAAIATLVVCAAYIAVIGAPAPALRSGVMLGATAVSRLVQRPISPWSALALGGAAPLVDPHTVLDVGYQLSVAGMAGLIASGALARRWLAPRFSGWRAQLMTIVLASLVSTLVTAPLVAWRFGRLSLVAPASNLLAAPVMAVAQPALFLALLLSPVPTAARYVADAAHPLLATLDAVAGVAASLPYASVAVAPTLIGAALAAAATAGFVVTCVSHFPARPFALTLAALAGATWLPLAPVRARGVELHLLDVGQGDAIALRTPRGRWVLFDAGRGWRGGDAGRSVVIPYVRALGGDVAAFVLSHPHTDHAGGAASVVTALRPAAYWDGAYAGTSDAYRASLTAAQRLGVRWRRARPGDTLNVDSVLVTFLAPDSSWLVGLDDPNEASVVALVRHGSVRFLLAGDAERGEERWLLDHVPEALRADVLKVGHHGSGTSTTPEFLAAVRPRVALVSVGAGNGYHHPSPNVVRALASARAAVLRTDQLGTVVVRSDGTRLWIDSQGETWQVSP